MCGRMGRRWTTMGSRGTLPARRCRPCRRRKNYPCGIAHIHVSPVPKVLHTFDSSTARRRCDKRCTRSGGGRRPCLDHMEATEEMVAMVGSAAAAGALSGSIYRSHQQSIDHPRIQHSSPDRSTRDLHIAYPHSTLKKIDVARASRFKFAGAVCWRRTHHHEEGDERCRH